MIDRVNQTISEIADQLQEPPRRVDYVVAKHRIRPAARIGIIRLFGPQQIEAIKQGLYGIQIRDSR